MPENYVFIKDLPYEYLRKKGIDFLDSQAFADHVSLFDEKKTTYTPVEPQTDKEVPDIAINYLKTMVVNKYLADPEFPIAEQEQAKMVWYFLQAKAKLDNKFKKELVPAVAVDSSISQFSGEGGETTLAKIDKNPYLDNFVGSRRTVPAAPSMTDAPSGNPVKDIVEKAALYQNSGVDPSRFDDHASALVRASVIELGRSISPIFPFSAPSTSVSRRPSVRKSTDLFEEALSLLRGMLIDRYLGTSHEPTPPVHDVDALRKSLLSRLSTTSLPRFMLAQYDSYELQAPLQAYEFDTGSGTSEVLFTVVAEEGDATASVNSEGIVQVATSAPVNVVLATVWDTQVASRPSLKRIFEEGNTSLTVRRFPFPPGSQWKFPASSRRDGVIVEAYDSFGSLIADPSIAFVSGGVRQVTNGDPDGGTLYVLSSVENGFGRSTVKINDGNIANVLRSVNLRSDRYRKWM